MRNRFSSFVTLVVLAAFRAAAADIPKAPVPQSPFIRTVYGYADAMLKSGRDMYGPQKTGLFLSALDRATMAPLTNRPVAAEGIRARDRVGRGGPVVGANLQHDQNLLRLLYTLSELSGKPTYRAAADAELKWLSGNAAATNGGLMPLLWDVIRDEPLAGNGAHQFARPWMLWDRCFEVAPDASKRLANEVRQNQTTHPTDSLRQIGFDIRTLAVAYARTKDGQFLQAIETLLKRCDESVTGLIAQTNTSLASVLSLAVDCDGAAHRVPEPLASRLRAFAAREDERFCSLPHNVKASRGFLTMAARSPDKSKPQHTPLWQARFDGHTTAQIGMMCVSRYDNTAKIAYRDLIFAAADAYLDALPSETDDVWPMTFGHAISLELAAWRHSAKPEYMDRARKLGEMAVEKFWGTNALPRASLKSAHYESITGAETLALALLELHLNILHITAVRCPPNTIDR